MASAGPLKAKVVLLGEGAVGKTSIVLRYVENKFNDKHLSTLQVSRSSGNRRTRYVMWARDGAFGCRLSYVCTCDRSCLACVNGTTCSPGEETWQRSRVASFLWGTHLVVACFKYGTSATLSGCVAVFFWLCPAL